MQATLRKLPETPVPDLEHIAEKLAAERRRTHH